MARRTTAQIEWSVAAALTIAALGYHVVTFLHQGALWRDEANAVAMGRMTLRDAWSHLPFDSILMAPIAVYHLMALAGHSGDDTALRALGMALGTAVLAGLWWAVLRLFHRPPLLALLLFGLSPVGVRYGDSLRAYGLAVLTMLAVVVLLWEAIRDPSKRRIALASLAAAVAVQCSYLNAVLIGALCAGSAVEVLRSGVARRLAAVLIPGLASAASLLVYLERALATSAVLDVQVRPMRVDEVAERLGVALVTPSGANLVPWLLGLVAALAVAGSGAARLRREGRVGESGAAIYLGTALAAAVLLYVLFLKRAGVDPNPWHFTPLLAFAALCLDGVVAVGTAASPRARVALAASAAVAGLPAAPDTQRFLSLRHTNVDRVAAILVERAAPGDLVVVSPYHVGVSFTRYYHGAADWVTLPPVEDHRVHRFDLLKTAMQSSDPLAPVFERAEETLRSGHRVFAVSADPLFQDPPARPETPPAPHPKYGWHAGGHFQAWAGQFGYFLETRAARRESIAVPGDEEVSPYEKMLLVEVEGYIAPGVVLR